MDGNCEKDQGGEISMMPECPEYWENPNDVCAAAERHGIFCYCKALTDTNFGMRHCPFYKTADRNHKEDEETDRFVKCD